ncbi:SDR family NAD(P)-dependent oxidoreductase [Streptomyces atacamensis]|uniref:SDR family NAD(P)-dependent oxidoreductase n=1 Tax=Streptomyces atacamensis TaxID=531966 RepID=UPI00399CA7DE
MPDVSDASNAPPRLLVVGATGVLGGAAADALARRGDALFLAGRDRERLASAARRLDAGSAPCDAYDLDGMAALPRLAAEAMGGLDGVLVAIGAVAFGPAEGTGAAVTEHLFAVNTLAPIAVLSAALPLLDPPGTLAATTGVVAVRPQPRMAAYSASKAALSAWLTAVAAERRRTGLSVADLHLPHTDTGLAGRAVAGSPPPLPRAAPLEETVGKIVAAFHPEPSGGGPSAGGPPGT